MSHMEKAVLSLEGEIELHAKLLDAIKTIQLLLPKVNPQIAQDLADSLCSEIRTAGNVQKAAVPA